MRRVTIVGALMAGLMLSGCFDQSETRGDGWSMIVAEDFSSAREHYQSLLADDPNNPYVNLNLGVAHEELGDTATAANHYRIAIANGEKAEINEVARDGDVGDRLTTVKIVATENLARLGG